MSVTLCAPSERHARRANGLLAPVAGGAAVNWQDEQFVKVYTRDTGEWTLLSWDAQANRHALAYSEYCRIYSDWSHR
jgi:hypothetical protein